ncbi:C45 family autoproteolytic acyltransferase/hydrolase [Myxococcus stipitatus]|uniref:C45 family autoproteolytic acyltransferase/hydolase n=1 Tax=Myxococcus stipitatus TaxID=83455 RepID=UPI0031456EDF
MPSDTGGALPLVVLSGRPYEVGRQYGSLMREEIARAVAVEDEAIRPMLELIGTTEQAMRRRLETLAALLPEDIHEEVRGVAEASGFPRDTILYHTLVLDILSGAPIGCSQFAAFGRATVDGKVLHGHNLDVPYASLARFLRPTCIVYRLEGRIPFASVTFWPVALGVCSGMNAEGLSLGVNVPVAPLDPRTFYPLTFQNREVLSRARTLDEARTVLEGLPRGGSWNLMLSHRSGASMVWEQVGRNSGQYTAHPEQDFIVSTNHLRVAHKAARGHEAVALEMLQDMQEDSLHRYRRLEQLAQGHWGGITLDTAVDFLRDCGEEGAPPSMKTICRADNALSMVYEPATLTLDFAAGSVPAARAPRRRIQLAPWFFDAPARVDEEERGSFPMQGTEREPDCWVRMFALDEDAYLTEHRVNGVPVLPGASAIEWLAEVAAVAGGDAVREVRGVSLEKFIRVRPERPTQACVRAARTREGFEVSAYSDLHNPRGAVLRSDVLHYRAEVHLGTRPPRKVPKGFGEARGVDGELPFSRSYVKDAYFHVGPPFRIVDWISYPHATEAVASLRIPEPTSCFTSIPWARFWLNPFVLDGCFQLAGTLGILHNLRAPVPKGAHRLVLGRTPRPGERLWCLARLDREVGELLFYDFTLWDAEGNVCLEAHDYCSISVDAYSPEQKAYLSTALDPSGVLHPRVFERRAHG